MKKYIIMLAASLLITACNRNKEQQLHVPQTKKELSLDQFEKAPVINDIQNVAFLVYPKNPIVKLYLHPDENAGFVEQSIEKTETLFGESEISNFYKIIYQIGRNPQNSKYAYILKSDVDKDNELLLSANEDLYPVRYININGKNSPTAKSFMEYGTIKLIDKTSYNTVFKRNQPFLLSNGNKPQIQDHSYVFRLRDGTLKEVSRTGSDEQEDELRYAGFSKDLDRQFFDVFEHGIKTRITSFSTINDELGEISFTGFPAFFKNKNLIATIGNDEAGCLLVIQRYNPQDYTLEELYAVNFTAFEISDSKNLIWDENANLYAEIHHPNTNTSRAYSKQYVMISFKDL